MKKSEILTKLKNIKTKYESEGVKLLGLFGSYSKDEADEFSDIDILYSLDYEKFSKKYKDGFSKLLRLEDIKSELEKLFGKKVDLVPSQNKELQEDLVNV